MKHLKKILFICVLLFITIIPSTIHAENMDGMPLPPPNGDNNNNGGRNDTKDEDDSGTADFISEALKSQDKKTAEEESSQNYIKNFYNSSVTAKTKGISLFNPSTILMCFLNMITTLGEMIGITFTFLLMLVYNLVSSSFMTNVIQGAFDTVDKVIFNWNDPNSWIAKVLLIITMLSILYQLIKNFTRMTHWKSIVQLVITSFVSMCFIVFIGQHGRPIANAVENTMNKMITQSFVFGDSSVKPEIANKENIFNIMQFQSFMVRHYGTTSYEAIAGSTDKKKVDAVKKRVQTLLDDPSEDNASKEYDDYDNKVITHNIPSAAQVETLSLIMLVHRFLIGSILFILCLAQGIIKVAKTIMLALSVYQLMWWLLKRTGKARQWFVDRIMWCAVAMFADIIFNAGLYWLVQVCAKVTASNVLWMIAIDIILLILMIFALKNIGTIAARLKDDGKVVGMAMLAGNSSPMDTFHQMKNAHSGAGGQGDNEENMDGGDPSKLSDDTYDDNLQDSDVNNPYDFDSGESGLGDHDEQNDLNDILDDTSTAPPAPLEDDTLDQNDTEKGASNEESTSNADSGHADIEDTDASHIQDMGDTLDSEHPEEDKENQETTEKLLNDNAGQSLIEDEEPLVEKELDTKRVKTNDAVSEEENDDIMKFEDSEDLSEDADILDNNLETDTEESPTEDKPSMPTVNEGEDSADILADTSTDNEVNNVENTVSSENMLSPEEEPVTTSEEKTEEIKTPAAENEFLDEVQDEEAIHEEP